MWAHTRFLAKTVFSDGFQLVGMLAASIAVFFTVVEWSGLPVADVLGRLRGAYERFAGYVYSALFFWLKIDVTFFVKSLVTTYVVLGMTATRAAIVFFSLEKQELPGFRAVASGFLNSLQFFRLAERFHQIGGRISPFLVALLIAPFWPYVLMQNDSKSIKLSSGETVTVEFRKIYFFILTATVLGAAMFVVSNSTTNPYDHPGSALSNPPAPGRASHPGGVSERLTGPDQAPGRIHVVASKSGLNIRVSPSLQSDVIRVLRKGERVLVLRELPSGWSEILDHEGVRGYVATVYLERHTE